MKKIPQPLWTQAEVEMLEARLRRIWDWAGQVEWMPDEEKFHVGHIQLRTQVLLKVWPTQVALCWEEPGPEWGSMGALICDTFRKRVFQTPPRFYDDEPPHWQDFLAQWTSIFRRNCWLCGYDIEASAHEKAEWIQGFTQEEVEAWNLQM